jgi:hypothetical protein
MTPLCGYHVFAALQPRQRIARRSGIGLDGCEV